MRRRNVGHSTLAACPVCGRVVDVPLDAKRRRVAEFDHETDHHAGYSVELRTLSGLLDPEGVWEKIIASYRSVPPGRIPQ
jgi:hypothetical protein